MKILITVAAFISFVIFLLILQKIGSEGGARTHSLPVNSRLLHHWATSEHLNVTCRDDLFIIQNNGPAVNNKNDFAHENLQILCQLNLWVVDVKV